MDDKLGEQDNVDGSTGDSKVANTLCEDGGHGGNQEELKTKETVEEQPGRLGRTVEKGFTVVKQFRIGSPAVDKDKGDNSESEGAIPHQPASEVSEDDSDAYDFSHQKRGRAIIINNEKFKPLSLYGDRPGSTADAVALKEIFKKLGFHVAYYKDQTAKEMEEIFIKEAKEYDHKNADCLVVAILSHGNRKFLKTACGLSSVVKDIILGVDGSSIFTDFIMRTFQDKQCPGLTGKPRLFFLQACRGAEYDDGRDILVYYDRREQSDNSVSTQPLAIDQSAPNAAVDGSTTEPKETVHDDSSTNAGLDISCIGNQGLTGATGKASAVSGNCATGKTDAVGSLADDDSDDDETDAFGQQPVTGHLVLTPAPIFKDYLVMYATTPGHFAWRRTTGSWFVQSLHSVFMKEYNPNMTLAQALTLVIRMVAVGYEAQGTHSQLMGKKQTPVMQSMLVKDIYFSQKGEVEMSLG